MKKAFFILAFAASANFASAVTLVHDVDFGPTSIGDPLFSVSLPLFDSALGTLDSVTITLDASTTNNVLIFDNEAGVGGTVTLSIGTTVTATNGFLAALVATPVQTGNTTVAADDVSDGAGDFSGPDSFTVSGGTGNDSDSDFSTNAGVLASFTGTFGQTFNTDITNVINTSTSTSGIFGPTAPTAGTFSGTVTVTYNYTVPEPSAALLGGLGLLALLRRRR